MGRYGSCQAASKAGKGAGGTANEGVAITALENNREAVVKMTCFLRYIISNFRYILMTSDSVITNTNTMSIIKITCRIIYDQDQ